MATVSQLDFLTESPPRIIASEPAPAPVADWDNDDECSECGAESGIAGAPLVSGGWTHTAYVICKHGYNFDEREGWRETITSLPERTVLIGGKCQWCRAKGGA